VVTLISENRIITELERIQYDFEDLDIPVKCLKTMEEIDIGDRKIKLSKNLRTKIPFWLAMLLEEEGLVELEEIGKLDFPELYRLALKEGETNLQKINKFFYVLMKRIFEDFEKKGKTIPYRQKESLEIKLRELMTMRLSKIYHIATKGKNITTQIRNMTPEEKWLYNSISEIIEKWKDMVKTDPEDENS